MSELPPNKSMSRNDLLAPEATETVRGINKVIRDVYDQGMAMTSWYGKLEKPGTPVGMDNRGHHYEPLPDAADDARLPWFLYWEIEWAMRHGPRIEPGMRVLDAGGTSSLFTCYLASLGAEVHSIDINPELIRHQNKIAKKMGWKMKAYSMDVGKLEFEDEYFDHAFSICVFEHLDFYIKRAAFNEVHRTMRPGGVLSVTFDYDNPAPYVFHYQGFDARPRNTIDSPQRVREQFSSNGLLEMAEGQEFHDNGERYLCPPKEARLKEPRDYSFGAVFLHRRDYW